MGTKTINLRHRNKNRTVTKRKIRVGHWVNFRYFTASMTGPHEIRGIGKVRRIKTNKQGRTEFHIIRKEDTRLLICYDMEVWPRSKTQEEYHPERFFGD